jgi:hypothetical protein
LDLSTVFKETLQVTDCGFPESISSYASSQAPTEEILENPMNRAGEQFNI